MFQVNYFDLFELPERFQICERTLKTRYHNLQKIYHPDRLHLRTSENIQSACEKSAYINIAYKTLSNPLLRAIYCLKLKGYEWKDDRNVTLSSSFLMEQMSLREAIAELKEAPSETELMALKKTVSTHINELTLAFQHFLEVVPIPYEDASLCIQKMQFFSKLSSEIETLETAVWAY